LPSAQALRKYCLIDGLDDIELTLRNAGEIRDFESTRLAWTPWLTQVIEN
jgi:3-isopropylmalate/(R)-2-methylmalate dehydratase small subunit